MIEIKVPELAESITEGTISQWYKNEGDKVEQGEAIAEIETDKVNMDIHAEHEGVLTKLLKQVGDTVLVGEAIAQLSTEAETTPSTPEKQEASAPQPAAKEQAEPEVKEQAAGKALLLWPLLQHEKTREMGIDLSTLSSRDPFGKIRPEDNVVNLRQQVRSTAASKYSITITGGCNNTGGGQARRTDPHVKTATNHCHPSRRSPAQCGDVNHLQ